MYLFSIILLLGAFTQGLTGFGLALVSVSLLSNFIDPQTAVPLAGFFGWIITFPLVVKMWPDVRKKEGIVLSLFSLPGSFLGARLLATVNADYILLAMGSILVVSSLYSIFVPKAKLDIRNRAAEQCGNGGVGFLSGVLGASVGEPGPPVIVWLSLKPWDPKAVKATLSFFFMIQMMGAMLGFLQNGLLDRGHWINVLWAAPGFLIGLIAGIKAFDILHSRKINYHTIVHALLLVIGARLIYKSASHLFF